MTEPEAAGTPDIVVLAGQLVAGMADLTEEFRSFQRDSTADRVALHRYGRRSRWIIVSDVVATIAFFLASLLFVQAKQHSDSAARTADNAATALATNHATAVASCESSNDYRAKDLERWQRLFALSPAAPTAAAAAQLAQINAINQETDALRDCKAIK